MSAAPRPGDAPQPVADQRVRDRIRNDLDTTLIIEAAAGTGKTTALINRIISVLAAGAATLDQIVAVTFTEKAAGELKLRLRAEIERARHDRVRFDAAARESLTAALPRLEEARIGTIHSFCADLLRERPVEAGVDPMFEVAPEDVSGALFEAAFERWFQAVLANPGEGVRRVLRRRELADREGPRPILRAAAEALNEWRDFDCPWRHESFERDRAIDSLISEIISLAGLAAAREEPDDWLGRALENIARPVLEATRLEDVRGRDYDALEDTLLRLLRGNQRHWGWKGRGERFAELPRAEVFARRSALHERLVEFRSLAGANLAPLLHDEIWPVIEYCSDLKRRAGRLDFLDLLFTARALVRNNRSVRAELQRRFTHIFIDEFQDTDPLQAEILLLLAAGDPAENDWRRAIPKPGKLFIVGDPKQSIYRFRRADVALYQNVKRRLLEGGAQLEHLTASFRATPEIQQMVNAAFAPLMSSETETQPAYAALEPFRSGYAEQPSVVVLPVANPYNRYDRITDAQLDLSLPDTTAAFLAWLVGKSGWTVTERDDPEQRIAIRPRHICILFRRLNAYGRDVTRPYVRALEARHIPHVLVRGGSFNEREEVEAIRNALAAIERPDDELCVYATLRGPLFGFADGTLLRFRETHGSLHPFRKLAEDLPGELHEVGDALEILRRLHRGRNRRPIAETIAGLLAATRAQAAIAIWPTGEQALANLMRLMDMARRYEANSGATSLRGFVDELEARAEREQAGDAPVVEEGTEGVRIMTVHSAKGLEFPIVVMADITCNEAPREARRYVDPVLRLCAQTLAGCAPRDLLEHGEEELRREHEEAVRVLYVAATRARDLVVVPAVGDERYEGWLGSLNPVVYPAPREARMPLERRPPGCPEFRSPLAGNRPVTVSSNGRGVAPGAHRPEAGTHRVVWWDPATLELDVRESMGLRQMRLLQADESAERSARGREDYERWRAGRAAMLERGKSPTLKLAVVTALSALPAAVELPEAAEIEVVEVTRSAWRPHGQRFGTLVHATLSRVSLDAVEEEIRDTVEFFARTLGAGADEGAAAIEAVMNALRSPVWREAREADEVRRETALAVMLEDGTLAEGVADLAFVSRDAVPQWVVVDFKTDLDIRGRLAEYRTQLALYLRAIRRASGLPARAILLWI
ncbi:MAG TPA: UvrD-helicase domain-containing protein [Candidatus Binataceae bacterium]|nr:UvrD-helicase domain-containing protein [Candidatus Binataceae bacterium]